MRGTPPNSGITAAADARARARTPDEEVFQEPGAWAQWFTLEQGYRVDQVSTTKAMAMFRQWVADGVSVGEVIDAVAAGEARAAGQPRSVAYFAGFVTETREARQQYAAGNVTTLARAGGDQSRQGRDHNGVAIREKHSRNGGKHDTRSKVDRKRERDMRELRDRQERRARLAAITGSDPE
jgi:hypothetical protein